LPVQGATTHGCGQPGPSGLEASTEMHVQPDALSSRQSASVLHGELGGAAGVVLVEVLGVGAASLLPHAATSRASAKTIEGLIDPRA
jgi:hypothetical protein